MTKRKSLSEILPIWYKVAEKKEIIRRHMKDFIRKNSFSNSYLNDSLPNEVYRHKSKIIKTGKDIDPVLQENKAFNIDLSSSKINGILIKPNEEFSFWKLVGKVTQKNGYKDGRVIINDKVEAGMGGGLCNLANTINLLIIHSPLKITEVHFHSDALASDIGKRIPLANGTSVAYNYVDYRFKNTTNQSFQINLNCRDKELLATLNSEKPISYNYKIVEENHHFVEENGIYYRKSKIYKVTEAKESAKVLNKELILDNKSKVMFDYDLIPKEQITP